MISDRAPLDDVVVPGARNALEGQATLSRFVAVLTGRVRAPLLVVPERTNTLDLPSTSAAEYLAQHGIEAEIIELKRQSGKSIAETLNDAATHREGAYLVMDAYGRSRFRERILGGVTRDMLRDPQLPLLLAH